VVAGFQVSTGGRIWVSTEGCVIISPQDVDGDAPRLELYRIGTRQSEVDLFTVPLRLPVAFRRDTLLVLDEHTNPQVVRILAAELK
jgi:hypothetical protein